ncbi:MAG: hypothetical protein FJZ96_10770 [Chloroflexi bacterium]|nr:hypothetical protein [Chloroflexota bacterium]
MNAVLSSALQDGLQALDGGMSLEECLARHPGLADQLRPLLETAQVARSVGSLPVPGNAATRGRARTLAHAARLRQANRPLPRLGGTGRVVAASLAALVFLALTGNGLIAASANALPGDPLYAIKRTVEDVRLGLAGDPQTEEKIEQEISTQRLEETEILLSEQRVEDVEFKGLVNEQLPDGWLVAGIPVRVTEETEVEGMISIGMLVEVDGQTQPDGSVLAERIRVLEPESSTSEGGPTPEDTPTPEMEETPLPEGTDDPTGVDPGDGDDDGGNSDSGESSKTPEPTDQTDD